MQRSASNCGRENQQPMPGCEAALHCMTSKRTLGEWDLCLEINVHSNLHPWMGGCWDCHGGDDWAELARRNASFWPEAVLDFIGPNLPVLWTSLTRSHGGGGGGDTNSSGGARARNHTARAGRARGAGRRDGGDAANGTNATALGANATALLNATLVNGTNLTNWTCTHPRICDREGRANGTRAAPRDAPADHRTLVNCPTTRSCLALFGSNASGAATAACRCTCNVSDAEVADMPLDVFANVSKMSTLLHALSGTYLQANHLTHDTRLCGGRFSYEWKHLGTCDEQLAFNKWLFLESCSPGVQGNVGSLASPADPLFNLMHPIFDKMAHVMRLAPQYADASSPLHIDESWASCDNTSVARGRWDTAGTYGSALDDELPFEDLPFIDAPRATAHGSRYTNKELWGLLNPANGHLPYIYDQFTSLGKCGWDPFGLVASRGRGGGDDDDGAAASDGGPPPGTRNASVGAPSAPTHNSSEPAGANVSRPVLADDDRAGTPPFR